MGRITIFSIESCPFCKKAKAALAERNIPFLDINVESYPEKRSDMLTLSDKLTVPQVFLNEKHIGGADETIALLESWDNDKSHASALEHYVDKVQSKPDPTNPRLMLPTNPPIVPTPPPERTEEDKVLLPNGSQLSVLELTEKLVSNLPRKNLSYYGKVYKNCFKGNDGVTSLMDILDIQAKDDAIQFGKLLQERHILHHVTNDHQFSDNSYFYRLQPYQTPKILNSYRVWTDRVDTDFMALLLRLQIMMKKIMSRCTDNNGDVDYIAAAQDSDYPAFQEAVCELQKVSMAEMDDQTKIAFGINLYNLMIKYAFIKVGIGSSDLQRFSFFSNVSFCIGGDNYTFNEFENGILRSNRKAPFTIQAPFSSSGDRRLQYVVKNVDPRIHFGLNCGAKSCPPVKKFTAVAIDEELRIVASAFTEEDANVLIDDVNYELHLTSIMNWYRVDFAESKQKLPEAVVQYLRGERKEKLKQMIDNPSKSIKVKFLKYDWSTNASKSKTYSSESLKSSKVSPAALFSFS